MYAKEKVKKVKKGYIATMYLYGNYNDKQCWNKVDKLEDANKLVLKQEKAYHLFFSSSSANREGVGSATCARIKKDQEWTQVKMRQVRGQRP